jgi:hypothetical protein
MISVLICSNNANLLKQVTNNITETIGIEFEILHFDNRNERKGLCEVYNKLANNAAYPNLCFIHEDILFNTLNWGKKIEHIFKSDDQIGLIGIAGCKYKSKFFSGWFSGVKELDCANYIHQYKEGLEKVNLSPDSNNLEEVVCIDGVFMCCKKEAWLHNNFDEDLLKGFHFYDIDFSLRIARTYNVVVTYEIELTHITAGGDYGNTWIAEAIKYHKKTAFTLPFSKIPVNKKSADKNVITSTLDFLKNYKIDFNYKIKWVVSQKLYLKPGLYYSIFKFFFYRSLGLKFIHNIFKIKWKNQR